LNRLEIGGGEQKKSLESLAFPCLTQLGSILYRRQIGSLSLSLFAPWQHDKVPPASAADDRHIMMEQLQRLNLREKTPQGVLSAFRVR
jgi:hypothetical protein